ncbi:ABC transporter permease [Candidatus Bathyarchaeota archaeon]|nr:ABC transporter permease [Candidatus Bathyarchaeota archaeon]
MPRKRLKVSPTVFVSLATAILAVVMWQWIATSGRVERMLMPTLWDLLQMAINTATKPFAGHSIYEHVYMSLWRVTAAFITSLALAIPLGLAAGWFKFFKAILDPAVEFLRPMPPLAVIPLLVLWFGMGEVSQVLVLLMCGFFPIFINLIVAIRSTDATLIKAASTLGANSRQVLTEVLLPAAMPYILAGIRISLGVMWATVIAAELVYAEVGIGHVLEWSRRYLETSRLIISMLITGAISVVLDQGVLYGEKRLTRWQEKEV